jgi:peptide/nickel transport system ATP-binding protein
MCGRRRRGPHGFFLGKRDYLMNTPILRTSDLAVRLPPWADRPLAISGINLSVSAGQTMCVVGESGSGKSVMAQSVMGMLPGSMKIVAGSIEFTGRPLPPALSRAMRAIRGARIAMIPQEPSAALNPIQRMGHQVEEVFTVHGVLSPKERRRRVLELFEAVHLSDPERIFGVYPHQVSGGQAQRVMIAMALALDPELLIADEPTTALDVTTQAEILKVINALKANRDAAIVFITHDFGVVAEVADQIAVMRSGEIVEQGTREEIFTNPSHPYTRSLLAAVPDICPRLQIPEPATVPVVEMREVARIFRVRAGLFKKREIPAVRGVSFTLERGKTIGIVGESGSGKSTLARCLLRLEPIDAGAVIVEGDDITAAPDKALRRLRGKMQVIMQDPYGSLNPRQRVGNCIAEGPVIHGTPYRQAFESACELLEAVGLSRDAAQRYPHEFSGGQRQRICIARALALNPDILVADEAVSALDVSIQAQILELLKELQKQFGFAMVFITHDLRIASSLCDQILVMQHGRAVEYGATAEIFENPTAAYTRKLLNALPGRDVNFAAMAAHSATKEVPL